MNTKIITILTFVIFQFMFGYSQPMDTLKIAVVGSSHVAQVGADLVGGPDSLWHRKYAVRYTAFTGKPAKVYQINSVGARTIGSIDARQIMGRIWSYTNYEASFGLVDSVLKVNPHLVIISAQSNEIANSMPCDTVIDCFKNVIDTLKARNVAFIITDGYARQLLFAGAYGVNAQTYHDSTVKFNNWLYANHNKYTARMYTKLYDSVVGYRPFPYVLGPDSLHSNTTGKTYTMDALLECPLTDSLFSDFTGRAYNLSLKKVGSNLQLNLKFKGRRIIVSGSNSLTTPFVKVNTVYPVNNSTNVIASTFIDNGYIYYKVEAISGKRTATKTFQIN